MRIGEVAQIVGISARSIRHYHRLGVLNEPARTTGGYRDYDVADLARIARIAFLSDSGVPLKEIRALLEPDAHDPATDLEAVRDGIDARIAELTRQRARLDVITDRAAAGLPPGLLPESVTRALDLCLADAADAADVANNSELAALVERERDMLDLAALSGDFPDELAVTYSALGTDTDRRRSYLHLLAGFQRIEGRRPADVEPQITQLVETLLAEPGIRSIVTGAPADADSDADADHPADAQHATTGPTLEQLLPDPAQREVLRRTFDALEVQP